MKIAKIVLLFYNSILIFSLVTIGFFTKPYQDLTSVILLLPVGIYFNLSLVNNITKLARYVKNPRVSHLRKVLRTYSLIVVTLFVFANIAASSNYLQSTLTLIFLPLLASFMLDFFNKNEIKQFKLKNIIALAKISSLKKKTVKLNKQSQAKKTKKKVKKLVESPKAEESASILSTDKFDNLDLEDQMEQAEEGQVEDRIDEFEEIFDVKDKKRRQFLRIVGGGGVSMFLMLFVFQQKASAAFFGSAPGPGIIGLKDVAGDKIDPAEKQPTDGYTISEIDDAALPSYYGFIHKDGLWYIAKEDSAGAYRYVSGASSFSTNWTNRASLTYDYFDVIF